MPFAADRDSHEAQRAVDRAAHMSVLAGHHFSKGQRAFFFSVGFLAWFAGAWPFVVVTLAVVVALARRQFAFPKLELFES